MSTSQSRHVYTREERAILEASFARQSHPDLKEKERLAKLFNCNLIQISNWFQNHRRRVKRMKKSTPSSQSSPPPAPCAPQYPYYSPQYSCVSYHEVPPSCYAYPPTTNHYTYVPSYYAPPSYEQVPPSYESFIPYYGYSETNHPMHGTNGLYPYNS